MLHPSLSTWAHDAFYKIQQTPPQTLLTYAVLVCIYLGASVRIAWYAHSNSTLIWLSSTLSSISSRQSLDQQDHPRRHTRQYCQTAKPVKLDGCPAGWMAGEPTKSGKVKTDPGSHIKRLKSRKYSCLLSCRRTMKKLG